MYDKINMICLQLYRYKNNLCGHRIMHLLAHNDLYCILRKSNFVRVTLYLSTSEGVNN